MIDPERNALPLRTTARDVGRVEQTRAPDATRPSGGAAFQALLEKLQAQAQRLGQESERIEKPADLVQAVEEAQVSLRDALALERELLEAYRQARSVDAAEPAPGAMGQG